MTEFTVKIADELFALCCGQENTKARFADYLTEETGGTALYASRQRRAAVRQLLEKNPDRRHTDLSPNYIEFLALHQCISYALIEKQVLLVHGSVVVADGEAVLFIAPSRTGKSTHTRLWTELPDAHAFVINDDKPLIRIGEKAPTVYATPWGIVTAPEKRSAPLKALVHLQRGENRIAAVEPHTLLVPLMQACQRGRTQEETIALTSLQNSLLCSVKTYTMTCQPDMAAAEMAYNTINRVGRNFSALSHHRTCRSAYGGSI